MPKFLRNTVLAFAVLATALAYAESANIKVGGSWREASEIHTKVGGSWREVEEGWIKVSGSWRQFFDRGVEFSMTRGNGGTNLNGYNDNNDGVGLFGSLSPSTYEGDDFWSVYTYQNLGIDRLRVQIAGSHAQSYFASIETSVGTFSTSSVDSFSDNGTRSRWEWVSGSSGSGQFASSGSETVVIVP